jgi:hypothetical protein
MHLHHVNVPYPALYYMISGSRPLLVSNRNALFVRKGSRTIQAILQQLYQALRLSKVLTPPDEQGVQNRIDR